MTSVTPTASHILRRTARRKTSRKNNPIRHDCGTGKHRDHPAQRAPQPLEAVGRTDHRLGRRRAGEHVDQTRKGNQRRDEVAAGGVKAAGAFDGIDVIVGREVESSGAPQTLQNKAPSVTSVLQVGQELTHRLCQRPRWGASGISGGAMNPYDTAGLLCASRSQTYINKDMNAGTPSGRGETELLERGTPAAPAQDSIRWAMLGAMPTSTVEDYLKCIYLQDQGTPGDRVSTGRIASAMGVAPGTVTAMVKALTESGLLDHQLYAGVCLTEAGRTLATHVLRRHRLVELFLVRVMGMDWTEVHEEAEILEHAVSERLIDRMDEMMGRPEVDPHGDPIPTAGGAVAETNHPSLLACELNRELRITRITDQRAPFLQLLERHKLVPGTRATVEERDLLAETVRIRPEGDETLQLGFQAASRILVEVL